jgi:hypothetical protein
VELYRSTFDWDGKARTLRAQLSHVFSRDGDMGWGLREAVARVQSDAPLREAIVSAYDGHPTAENVVDALILFQRSLDGGLSRFDRYYLLSDSVALSERERRGWELFRGSTAGCAGCHVPLPEPRGRQVLVLRDNRFHNLGVGYSAGVFHDLGHEEVSLKSADLSAFATPSLRHVAATAPYMHDGSLTSLDEVVRFYERGGIANPHKDITLRPFVLSDVERRDLVAFLCALTGENVASTLNAPSCREWIVSSTHAFRNSPGDCGVGTPRRTESVLPLHARHALSRLSVVAALVLCAFDAAKSQSVIRVDDRTSCTRCTFSWETLATLEGMGFDGPATSAVLAPGGRFYFVDFSDGQLLKSVDLSSGQVSVLGRRGAGPGEYEVVRNLLVDGRRQLHLLDAMLARRSVFSERGVFVGSGAIDLSGGMGRPAILLRDSLVLASLRPARGVGAVPIVSLYDGSGKVREVVQTIPASASARWAGDRLLARVSDSTFFVADVFGARGALYALRRDRAHLLAAFEFRADWRQTVEPALPPSDGVFARPYSTQIRGIWADSLGRIWIYSGRPSSAWKPAPEPSPGRTLSSDELAVLTARPRLESVIDVLDPSTGLIVARAQLPGSLGHAIGGGVFLSTEEHSSGEPRIVLRQVHLSHPH